MDDASRGEGDRQAPAPAGGQGHGWVCDQAADDRGDLDEFSARGSEPTLRRLDEQEEAVGFSWEKETLTGAPMPDVADAVRRSRESH